MGETLGNFDIYDQGLSPVSNIEHKTNNSQLSKRDTLLISMYLRQTQDKTKDKVDSIMKGFSGKEQELLQYLRTLKNTLPVDDNMLDDFMQIGELESSIKNQLGNLKNELDNNHHVNNGTTQLNHRELNSELPQSTSIKISKAFYYHEGIGPDHTRNLTKIYYSPKLNNGLQQGESGTIRMSDGIYSWEINIKYEGDGLLVKFGRYTEFITLANNQKNRPLNLVLGNEVARGKRGTYLKINLRLNWR